MERVGVIGLGNIGGAIAANLVADGHRVTVSDVDPSRATAVAGAEAVADVAAVADASEITITSLPTPEAVASVADEWVGPAAAGAILLDISTSAPATNRELATKLRDSGHHFVEAPLTGGAYVVGLTGSPGVGKSTSTSALVTAYRRAGKRVGVLAVDPSSPFSGGALLGDRIRMSEHASDPGVYIRSMATRGHLGGLAWAAPQAIRVLDAAGCDVILVETVGVGQSEVEIAAQADTSVVLLAPGMGDGIQAAKAGPIAAPVRVCSRATLRPVAP